MAVEPISAGILGVGQLLGGLFGAAAERKRKRDAQIYEGIKEGLNTKMEGAKDLGDGQQLAFEDMIANYRGLVR